MNNSANRNVLIFPYSQLLLTFILTSKRNIYFTVCFGCSIYHIKLSSLNLIFKTVVPLLLLDKSLCMTGH